MGRAESVEERRVVTTVVSAEASEEREAEDRALLMLGRCSSRL